MIADAREPSCPGAGLMVTANADGRGTCPSCGACVKLHHEEQFSANTGQPLTAQRPGRLVAHPPHRASPA